MLEGIATIPPVGGYVSLGKIVTMFVFVLPWLYLAPWVDRDSKFVRAPKIVWSASVLGAGALGVLLWLVIPTFLAGLLIYVGLAGSVLLAYAVYRDGRVEPNRKVLTIRHLQSLLRMGQRDAAGAASVEKVKLYNDVGKIVFAPKGDQADLKAIAAYNLVQDLMYDVIYRRASMAELSPHGVGARVRYVIDGVVVDRPEMSLGDSQAIIECLKPIAGMDPQQEGASQEGKFSVDAGQQSTDVTIKTAGSDAGQVMQLRVVQEVAQTKLDELGMSSEVLQRVREHNETPNGLIIVAGKRGCGVTSTLYSLLRVHDAFIKQLVSLETKETVELENITQHSYGEADSVAATLASALRRDPDVIMLDQCPDARTAELIVDASGEKVILLGMEAGDSFAALAKWVKVCSSSGAAMKNLHAVLYQILIRRLCEACREEYRPDPQLLAKANVKVGPDARFCRPPTGSLVDEKGRPIICPACQNTRYVGRTGVFELLELPEPIKNLVVSNASLAEIKTACRKNKMLYVQEQALRKSVRGITGIKEVIRMTQKAKT